MPEQVSGYIATFHTHLSALLTCQSLTACGAAARMMPVPRKLSASCGTCVRFTAPFLPEWADEDLEAVYETTGTGNYRLLYENAD